MVHVIMTMIQYQKRIVARRPFVGEYIICHGITYEVNKITIMSKTIIAAVTPERCLTDSELDEHGWQPTPAHTTS